MNFQINFKNSSSTYIFFLKLWTEDLFFNKFYSSVFTEEEERKMTLSQRIRFVVFFFLLNISPVKVEILEKILAT